MQTKTSKLTISGILMGVLLVFLVLLFIMPILWVIGSSFKTAGELFSWPPSLFGKSPALNNYLIAMREGDFARYFLNTVFVTIMATFLTVFVNVLSGYAIAKYKF